MVGRGIIAIVMLCTLAGCATAPKPKTVGQVVGSVVDSAIAWTSLGVEKILNK